MPPVFRGAIVATLLLTACAHGERAPRNGPSPPPAPVAGVSSNGPGASVTPPGPTAGTARTVLLVSLDAFHPRYLDMGLAPAIAAIGSEGVRAAWLQPSYPSLTFPNHYTLVTGLRPDRHGLVHNTMRDEVLGNYKLSLRDAVGDGRWYGGQPLWIAAQRAGMRTATMFWPGSEAEIDGVRPDHWLAYDKAMPLDARVDTLLGWLRDAANRPRFATLYLESVDEAGHDFGPDSPQALDAVREVDAAVAALRAGIDAAGLRDRVDLVVVSDHGMATVPVGQAIAVEDMADPADAVAVTTGQIVMFAPQPGREAAAERALLGRHAHHACWRRGELPARWHFGANPRIPAIVCQMDEGWDAVTRKVLPLRPVDHPRGSHGYDPALPSMRALFVATGPSFRKGLAVPPIDNVDVYPLLAHLLGVPAAAGDGDFARVRGLLAPAAE